MKVNATAPSLRIDDCLPDKAVLNQAVRSAWGPKSIFKVAPTRHT